MPRDVATQQTVEILTALKKLGEVLTPAEEAYLQTHSSSSLRAFEEVSSDIGEKSLFEGKTFLQFLILDLHKSEVGPSNTFFFFFHFFIFFKNNFFFSKIKFLFKKKEKKN